MLKSCTSLRAMLRVCKTVASSVWLLLLAAMLAAHAQQSASSAPRLPAWNDNSLIEIQKKGGDPARAGDVKIDFYGPQCL